MEKEQEQPEPKEFSNYEFKKELKGAWNSKLDKNERVSLGKDLFSGKSKITESDMNKALRKLKQEKFRTRDLDERKKLDNQMKLIEKIKDK